MFAGGVFVIGRDPYLTLGGFDERYFAYWNDTDWCYRVRAAGRRIFCVPGAQLYHHETSATSKGKRPIRIWLFHYNAYRLHTRWKTLGYWDPRSVLAGVALLGRALLLIAYHRIPWRWSEAADPSLEPRVLGTEPSGTGVTRR